MSIPRMIDVAVTIAFLAQLLPQEISKSQFVAIVVVVFVSAEGFRQEYLHRA
jgi:hypothetical protein